MRVVTAPGKWMRRQHTEERVAYLSAEDPEDVVEEEAAQQDGAHLVAAQGDALNTLPCHVLSQFEAQRVDSTRTRLCSPARRRRCRARCS